MGKAVLLYWSQTGNTEKVALSIQKGLEAGQFVTVRKKGPGRTRRRFLRLRSGLFWISLFDKLAPSETG